MMALDDTQTTALLKSLKASRLYLPVALAVSTGMRRGELLALRWAEVDLDKAQISVNRSLEQTKAGLTFKTPKTERSRRRIALPKVIVKLLRAHKASQAAEKLRLGPIYQDRGFVCARPDGTPWPPDTFSTLFAAHIRRHKLPPVRFHDLRHTHATQLLKQGVHPKIVSERLGHSNISITLDTYSHVLPGMQEQAVAAIDTVLAAAIDQDG
jgi:integrase